MQFDDSVFKAYDIRGKAEEQLTADLAESVGRAFADHLGHGPIAVGRDMREDSGKLADALIRGLVRQGRTVWDIGLVSSDMIYFAAGHYTELAGGAMVTASHNPGADDGIKLCGRDASPIGKPNGLWDIKFAIRDEQFQPEDGGGKVVAKDITGDWTAHVLHFIDRKKIKPLKLAVDAGNGMAGRVWPFLQEELPQLKVLQLFFELDGTFPNHLANPLDPKNLKDLQTAVASNQLDLGVAFDGDGDRAFLVDEHGAPVSASQLLAVLAKCMLTRHPGATVGYNALCSRVVPEVIRENGGVPLRTKVGGAFIKSDMRTTGAILAGEHSGHFYFKGNYYSDSGLIAVAIALQALSESGMTLSQLVAPYKKFYATQEINRHVDEIGHIVQTIIKHYRDADVDLLDGITVTYPHWWFNIRASNTEPVIRLNVEADNAKLLEQKTFEVLNLVRS